MTFLGTGVRGIRAIAAGFYHGVALTEAGTVITWGDNNYGDLGRGRNAQGAGVVAGVNDVQSIAATAAMTTTVLGSGRIMNWGVLRPWTQPGGGGGNTPTPILLWLDGPDYP